MEISPDLRSLFHGLPPDQKALLEEFVETEESLLQAIAVSGVDVYSPLPHQELFHRSGAPNRWIIGSNRMGKSRAINQEVRWFAEGTHPYREVPERGSIWCCCPSFEKSQNFQIPEIRKALGPLIRRIVDKPNPMAELANGKRIIFKTYEQHHQKFASEEPILVVLDEEPPYDIMDEIYARRSAHHELQIIGGVTMTQGLTWLYDKVIMGAWPEAVWFGGKMTDNIHLSKEEVSRFDKGITGVMRDIRFLGKILPIGGSVVFDPDRLAALLTGTRETPWQFDWTGSSWTQKEEGPLKIWRWPEKEFPDEEFVIGCDPAEGLNTSHSDADPEHDETAIHVKSRHKQDIVAEYVSGIVEPDMVGEQILPSISDVYHAAKVNPERNNHGHTVIAFFKRKYPSRLYIPPDDVTDVHYRPRTEYGHLETGSNTRGRPYLIDLLRKRIRTETRYRVPSAKAVRQMLTFVLKANGRMEHQEGSKDDCVFSLGLCEILDHELPAPRIIKPQRPERRQVNELLRIKNESSEATQTLMVGGSSARQKRRDTDWFGKM
jgi:phage terminase large subunit-like protein